LLCISPWHYAFPKEIWFTLVLRIAAIRLGVP
jgi:hypothetical protein